MGRFIRENTPTNTPVKSVMWTLALKYSAHCITEEYLPDCMKQFFEMRGRFPRHFPIEYSIAVAI